MAEIAKLAPNEKLDVGGTWTKIVRVSASMYVVVHRLADMPKGDEIVSERFTKKGHALALAQSLATKHGMDTIYT
jgi:hypothetical protein